MTHPGWYVAVLVPAAAVTAAAWPVAARQPGVEGTRSQPVEAASLPPVVGQPVGVAGCSSTGCHGAPAGELFRAGPGSTTWPAAAVLWSAADPHRKAYAVLEGELATRMMASLYPDKKPEERKATDDARCLACHTSPSLAASADPHAVALRAEGVSCEGCHGNASGWLRTHTGFTPETRTAGYDSGGMAKLYDLGERALACAGCHVGAPAGNGLPVRDMNHDMIAAGHPRLNFDFATYQAMLPKHWYERDRTKPGSTTAPDFEARAWLVGRFAHAEAACRLTADRAKRADPWPEFAEYSCVACHHTVANPDTPYPGPTGRKPGSLPWQPIWPVTGPLEQIGGAAFTRFVGAMQRSRPAPDAGALAESAARELGEMRAAAVHDPDATATATRLTRSVGSIPHPGWDRDLTEQVFHAAAALERNKLAVFDPGADPARFAAVAKQLTLPRGTVRFDLPAGAADAVRGLVK
jgi:hypothetical protein